MESQKVIAICCENSSYRVTVSQSQTLSCTSYTAGGDGAASGGDGYTAGGDGAASGGDGYTAGGYDGDEFPCGDWTSNFDCDENYCAWDEMTRMCMTKDPSQDGSMPPMNITG